MLKALGYMILGAALLMLALIAVLSYGVFDWSAAAATSRHVPYVPVSEPKPNVFPAQALVMCGAYPEVTADLAQTYDLTHISDEGFRPGDWIEFWATPSGDAFTVIGITGFGGMACILVGGSGLRKVH